MSIRLFVLCSLSMVFAPAFFSGCRNDNNPSQSIDPETVRVNLSTGTWRVTLFNDSGQDETAHFSGYTFTFASGNLVTATKSGSTVSGTWNTGLDNTHTKIVLNFTTPADFLDLNNDWHVLEQSAVKVRLEDVSGGNGGTDYLTFEKN